jgi:sugar-specific transcriptional regulator TrmB
VLAAGNDLWRAALPVGQCSTGGWICCARRRYEAVDPENRLVARTLERDWEAALAAEQALQVEHERELARQPARLQAAEIEAIRHLAEDVPALWHAPTTTATDRQMIARLMLEQVTVRVEANSEHVEVTCDVKQRAKLSRFRG